MFDFIRHPDETPQQALVRVAIISLCCVLTLGLTGLTVHHTLIGWLFTYLGTVLGVTSGAAVLKFLSEIKVKP